MPLPLAVLLWRWADLLLHLDARAAGLSAEPVAFTINYLGLWTIRLLMLTLAITPVRRMTGWNWLAAWRRPVGLWCFAYGLIHLSVYFALDQLGSFDLLWRDIMKNRFILFGMAALLLLLPLAITSTRAWIRRLGGRPWQMLHRLIYASALFATVHFILRVKGFQIEPWIYAGLMALLLLSRIRISRLRPRTS